MKEPPKYFRTTPDVFHGLSKALHGIIAISSLWPNSRSSCPGLFISIYLSKPYGAWYINCYTMQYTSVIPSPNKMMDSTTLPQWCLLIRSSLHSSTPNMPFHRGCGMILTPSPAFLQVAFKRGCLGKLWVPKILSGLPKTDVSSIPTGAWFMRKASK